MVYIRSSKKRSTIFPLALVICSSRYISVIAVSLANGGPTRTDDQKGFAVYLVEIGWESSATYELLPCNQTLYYDLYYQQV